MPHAYSGPVAKLLTYQKTDLRFHDPWPDYQAIGLTGQHVPELIQMAKDAGLHLAGEDSPEVWAPLHAWRALGQLRAAEAAPDLIRLLEEYEDDDWLPTDLRAVFSMMGPATIPALADFIGDDNVDEYCRMPVPECLEQIATDHPQARDKCVSVLIRQLEKHEWNGGGLNGLLILSLTKLRAVEAMEVIREAFAQDHVDVTIQGDLEDTEIGMGVRTERETPSPRYGLFAGLDKFAVNEDDIGDYFFAKSNVPARRGEKIGRNEPCPCGSGRKFKKCCLN